MSLKSLYSHNTEVYFPLVKIKSRSQSSRSILDWTRDGKSTIRGGGGGGVDIREPLADRRGRPAPFATSYMVGREDKSTNNRTMLPTLKNNAAAEVIIVSFAVVFGVSRNAAMLCDIPKTAAKETRVIRVQ